MKKIFLMMAFAFVAVSSFAQKITDPKQRKEMKDIFYNECMTAADPNDKETYPVMKKYCDCSGEKMLDKFTRQELEKFADMTEEELAEIVMPAIQGCLEKMQKDIEAIEKKKSGDDK
jgi:hypothetical protein